MKRHSARWKGIKFEVAVFVYYREDVKKSRQRQNFKQASHSVAGRITLLVNNFYLSL